MFAPGFAPYAASENICSSKLALALMERGYDVSVVSRQDEGFNYGTDWTEPWLPLKAVTHEIRYPVGMRLGRVADVARAFGAMGFVLPGLRWARRAYELAMELHAQRKFDVILSRAPNDIAHVPALQIARRTGLPWIANWNDPPMHLWPEPYAHRLSRLTEWMSIRLLEGVFRTATCVAFPSARLMKHVIRNAPATDGTMTTVIPHMGYGGSVPAATDCAGVFKICHAGNLSRERCPKTFLEGYAAFLSKTSVQDRVALHVVGVEHPDMRTLAAAYGLNGSLTFSGGLPYLATMQRLAQSDLLLLVEAPCQEGIFLPSKLADYACLGKPVLAVSPSQGTVRDLLSRHGGGLCTDNRSAKDIEGALLRFYRAWKDGVLDQTFSSASLARELSVDSVVSKYEGLFLKCL